MTIQDKAGIILVIPSDFDILARKDNVIECVKACEGFHLACLRLQTGDQQRETIIKRADTLREIGHEAEVSIIVDDHFSIAQETGLDGVHLTNADPKILREAKSALGNDAIIGVYAGASKHDGMTAGEIGTDFISFGPLSANGLNVEAVDPDLFAWWSEVIEIPVVVEGGLNPSNLETIRDFVDFVSLGREVFDDPNPATPLRALLAVL